MAVWDVPGTHREACLTWSIVNIYVPADGVAFPRLTAIIPRFHNCYPVV